MGITLDQGRGGMFVAVGLEGVAKGGEVGAQLIVLERETKALVREALDAFADGVIFKSSLGTGRGDLIAALHTIAEGGV